MSHPIKISADLFASLQEEAAREGLTLQAVLQRRLDEGDRTVRELANGRARLEDQLAALRTGLRTAGNESAQDKRRLGALQKEQAGLADALRAAEDKRSKLADALREARGESTELSSQLTTAKMQRDRDRKTLWVLIGVLVVGSLIGAGYLWWLRRSRVSEKQPMERGSAVVPPYQFPQL
jgi:uncharacterized phage infection (PIP) family protein YhgE